MAASASLIPMEVQKLEKLHQAGVKMLTTFGVRIEDPEMRTLLEKNGCVVTGERVKYCPQLIEAAVKNAKKTVTMASPTGAKLTLSMEAGQAMSHSTGGAPWVLDPKTGQRRNGLLSDLVDSVRVMNHLDALNLPCALVYPSDVASPISQFMQAVTMLRYSKKPIYGPGISTAINAKYIAELFQIYGGPQLAENPIGLVGISPESPLFLPKEITDTLQIIVQAGIPVSILSAPMGGLTAPVTVAGCVAQAHAEILSFAVLAYLINPKTVLFYGARTFFANMKTGQSILGLPETGISSAIAVQLATHCGFMSDVYGLACTSCTMDEQTGYEKMLNALLPALAGATMITGYGSLGSVMCASLGQLVIDNEMLNMIKKAQRAIEVTDDVLGFEAIEAVVEGHESFLEQPHTVEYLQAGEIFTTQVGFDSVWADWVASGEKSLEEKANAEALRLIEKDQVAEEDPAVAKAVQQLIEQAKQEME